MKIAHLTSVHTTFDTRIFHKECVTLAEAGHDVVLICCAEQDEMVSGVRIRALRRPRNRYDRLVRVVFMVARVAVQEKADVYHFHDPELIAVGIMLRLFGRQVVYDVHEDVPLQVLNKTYMPWIVRRVGSLVAALGEKLAGLTLSRVVAATPLIAEKFSPKKTITIQNFPILSEFERSRRDDYEQRDPNFVYVGALSRIRGIVEIVEAIGLVPEKYKARLQIAGSFPSEDLKSACTRLAGWQRVDYLGWVDRSQLAALLGASRGGLVTLHRTRNYEDSYPVKLFEYMAAGLPSIATDFPLWREIVTDARCGFLVDPMNANEIADAMVKILEDPQAARSMGEQGLSASIEKYNWQNEANKLTRMYEDLDTQPSIKQRPDQAR